MEIYNYNENGFLVSIGEADESPLEPGVFLIPALATTIPAPELKVGYFLKFDGAEWGYVPIVDPEIAPTTTPMVTTDMVNAERSRRIASGTQVDVAYHGYVALQGRDEDKTNLQGLAFGATLRISGGDTTTLSKFRDAQNVDHFLTPPQLVEMWSLGSAWISSVFQASWDLKAMDPIPLDYTDDKYWP